MKKNSLIFIFLLGTYFTIYSQSFSVGFKGGINQISIGELYHWGNWAGSSIRPEEDTYYTANKEMGFQVGAYFVVNYDYFYIRPELYYTSSKSSYDLAYNTMAWEQTSIDIPFLFGYRVFGGVSLYAGPMMSLINDRQLQDNKNTSDRPWSYEKTLLYGSLGLNIEYGRFGLDIRYLHSFTKTDPVEFETIRVKYGTHFGEMLEYNPSQFQISLNVDLFYFGGEKKKKKFKSDWRNHKNL